MSRPVICQHCDLVSQSIPLSPDERAVCPRCKQTLYHANQSLNKGIALLFSALIVYFPAMTLPFLRLEISEQEQSISLLQSTYFLFAHHNVLLGLTLLCLIVLFPLIRFVGLLLIVIPLSRKRPLKLSGDAIRWLLRMSSWGMIEVYLVAVLITIVKLIDYAGIVLVQGFYLFAILVVLNALISLALPNGRIWQQLRRSRLSQQALTQYDTSKPKPQMTNPTSVS